MKFWAVLGSQGCRQKKLPTAISKQLFEVFFSAFCGQIFKLADRMRSMRTNGASKNRDWPDLNG